MRKGSHAATAAQGPFLVAILIIFRRMAKRKEAVLSSPFLAYPIVSRYLAMIESISASASSLTPQLLDPLKVGNHRSQVIAVLPVCHALVFFHARSSLLQPVVIFQHNTSMTTTGIQPISAVQAVFSPQR